LAQRWFARAAAQGYVRSQYALARQLIEHDRITAYAWLLRAGQAKNVGTAGKLGQRIENLRQRLAANLTTSELRTAEQQASNPEKAKDS